MNKKCEFCRCARCRWQGTDNCLYDRRPPCSWCGPWGNMKHSDIVGQCKRFVKRMEVEDEYARDYKTT